jgi:multicomponent Na+:H+ antiporter subunit G
VSAVVEVISWAALLTGGFLIITGGIGMLRFPDLYTRLHAAGVTDTGGAGLVLFGLMLQAGLTIVTVKLALILWFLLFTGPVASHVLAKAALHAKLEPLVDEQGEGAPFRHSSTS